MAVRHHLTRAEFRAWLASLPENTWVGARTAAQRCPVANFLFNRTGKVFFVGRAAYKTSGGDIWALPKWTRVFISKVDRSGNPANVYAGEALYLLDQIQ